MGCGLLSRFHPRACKESGLRVSTAQPRTHRRFLPSEGVRRRWDRDSPSPLPTRGTCPPCPGTALPAHLPGTAGAVGPRPSSPGPGNQSSTLHGAGRRSGLVAITSPVAMGSSGYVSVEAPASRAGGLGRSRPCTPSACGPDTLHSPVPRFRLHVGRQREHPPHTAVRPGASWSFHEHLNAVLQAHRGRFRRTERP